MKIDTKDSSVFANKADALMFFVDGTGNAPKQANAIVPDICQVAQMMALANSFPDDGLVFTTLEDRKIIVSLPKLNEEICASIIRIIKEHDIQSINIAPTDFFDPNTVSEIAGNTEADVTLIFCNPLA